MFCSSFCGRLLQGSWLRWPAGTSPACLAPHPTHDGVVSKQLYKSWLTKQNVLTFIFKQATLTCNDVAKQQTLARDIKGQSSSTMHSRQQWSRTQMPSMQCCVAMTLAVHSSLVDTIEQHAYHDCTSLHVACSANIW